jgi:hypothetical protein
MKAAEKVAGTLQAKQIYLVWQIVKDDICSLFYFIYMYVYKHTASTGIEVRYGILKLLRSPGIDSKESIRSVYVSCAGHFKQSMGAVGTGLGLSYRPGRYGNPIPTRFPIDCSKMPAQVT